MNTYSPSYWSGDNPRVERILSGRTAHPQPSSGTALEEQISSLCRKVADGGDEAVLEATSSFDGISISSPVVNAAELEDLASRTPQDVKESLDRAMKNSLEFNEKIVSRANWEASSGGSYRYGEIVRPVEAAGLFVPNGKGRFPSVAVQIGCPAVAAGVERLVLASSPCSDDAARLDPAVAHVARRLGVEQVLCANGPALIAALAFGTESVRPVPLIAGPGSAPVVIAQRFVSRFGVQSVPGLGPTDSFIVADATADPVLLAADLINEAEHGMDSSAILVCTDETVTEKAIQYVREQIEELPHRVGNMRSAVSSSTAGSFWSTRSRTVSLRRTSTRPSTCNWPWRLPGNMWGWSRMPALFSWGGQRRSRYLITSPGPRRPCPQPALRA